VSYLCSLDGAAFAACSSPRGYPALAQGSHTFRAEARLASQTSAATSYTWLVDTPPTVSSIAPQGSNPTGTSGSVSWTVTFSKPVTGVGSGEFQLVAGGGLGGSPSISGLSGSGSRYTVTASSGSGSGTLGLNLVDDDSVKDGAGMPLGGTGAGNGSFTGGVFTFVRSVPPVPSISSGPPASPAWTTTTNASFSFTDSRSGVSFLCKLDGGSFVTCSSPKSYGALAQGGHSFQVEARDAFGTSAPASWAWQVDTVPPPDPHFTSGPNDPTNQTSASFKVSESDHTASLLCSLDGAAYTACPPSLTGLHEGEHTYRVIARDQAGNQSGADGWSWFVDLTPPPVPAITLGPPAFASSTSAAFLFFVVDPGHDGAATTYRCSLDGGAYAPCYLLAGYSGLSQGSHAFRVEAVDQAGNASGPRTWTWVVDTIAPTVQLDQPLPPNPDTDTSPTFAFHGTDTGGSGIAGYQCKLDGGSWAACSSPDTLDDLSLASHTFEVEATDKAGNTSSPASYTWTVQAAGGTGMPFSMAGDVNAGTSGDLYPGGPARAIPIAITNPNSVPILVTEITVTITTGTLPAGCQASWFEVGQSNVSTTNTVTVPANGSVTLPAGSVTAPTIQMLDDGPQDLCAGATFSYSFTGSAHS
jgi:large repetitive protein